MSRLNQIDFSRKNSVGHAHIDGKLGEKMRDIYKALLRLAEDFADGGRCVIPVHLNPIVVILAVEMLGRKGTHPFIGTA
jgi:UDP-N-acetylglucosamine 2-epimerase